MKLVIVMLMLTGCGHVTTQYVTGSPVNGTDGTNGADGLSVVFNTAPATTLQCSNGGTAVAMANATIGTPYSTSLPNQSVFFVCNGQNGQTPLSVISTVAPCTNASSPWKEQLLCLSDGSLLGDFSDNASGLNTRFAFIPNGSYIDTDSSGCNFNVNVASDGSSTVSWNAGSNSYGNWTTASQTCQKQ